MAAQDNLNQSQFYPAGMTPGEPMSLQERYARGTHIAQRLAAHFDVPEPITSHSPHMSRPNRAGEYVPERGPVEPARLNISTDLTGHGNFEHTVVHEFAHHLDHIEGHSGHGETFVSALTRVQQAWRSMSGQARPEQGR